MKTANTISALGLIFACVACGPASRLTNGIDCRSFRDSFFGLPRKQQIAEFPNRDIKDQYEIYICGNQAIEPPVIGLADAFSRQGQSAVPFLVSKLNAADDDLTVRDIVNVFREMSVESTYDVAHDQQLMKLIQRKTSEMKDEDWKSITEKMVSDIR